MGQAAAAAATKEQSSLPGRSAETAAALASAAAAWLAHHSPHDPHGTDSLTYLTQLANYLLLPLTRIATAPDVHASSLAAEALAQALINLSTPTSNFSPTAAARAAVAVLVEASKSLHVDPRAAHLPYASDRYDIDHGRSTLSKISVAAPVQSAQVLVALRAALRTIKLAARGVTDLFEHAFANHPTHKTGLILRLARGLLAALHPGVADWRLRARGAEAMTMLVEVALSAAGGTEMTSVLGKLRGVILDAVERLRADRVPAVRRTVNPCVDALLRLPHVLGGWSPSSRHGSPARRAAENRSRSRGTRRSRVPRRVPPSSPQHLTLISPPVSPRFSPSLAPHVGTDVTREVARGVRAQPPGFPSEAPPVVSDAQIEESATILPPTRSIYFRPAG